MSPSLLLPLDVEADVSLVVPPGPVEVTPTSVVPPSVGSGSVGSGSDDGVGSPEAVMMVVVVSLLLHPAASAVKATAKAVVTMAAMMTEQV